MSPDVLETLCQREEEAQALHKFLERVQNWSPLLRSVLSHTLDGESPAQIAKALHTTPNTVSTTKTLIRSRLKDLRR